MREKWRIGGGKTLCLGSGLPDLVIGILNITPDSFSDGGLYLDPPQALIQARRLQAEGADILDLGGESTRPGSAFVGAEEELARLLPVMRLCREISPRVSVDTWRASTARRMLEEGAEIINDIAGGIFDPEMPAVLAEYQPGYILGHCPASPRTMQYAPCYGDVVEEVYAYFAGRLEALIRAGLPEEHIVLDPGLGFGKTLEHNLELLRCVERFYSLGRPLCMGASRKSMLGELLGLEKGSARDASTQTLCALLAERGVHIHRVHNVLGARQALQLREAVHTAPKGM